LRNTIKINIKDKVAHTSVSPQILPQRLAFVFSPAVNTCLSVSGNNAILGGPRSWQ